MSTVRKLDRHNISHRYVPKADRKIYDFNEAHLKKQALCYIKNFYVRLESKTEDIANLTRINEQVTKNLLELAELSKSWETEMDKYIEKLETLITESEEA